jgi:hypothetical protein
VIGQWHVGLLRCCFFLRSGISPADLHQWPPLHNQEDVNTNSQAGHRRRSGCSAHPRFSTPAAPARAARHSCREVTGGRYGPSSSSWSLGGCCYEAVGTISTQSGPARHDSCVPSTCASSVCNSAVVQWQLLGHERGASALSSGQQLTAAASRIGAAGISTFGTYQPCAAGSERLAFGHPATIHVMGPQSFPRPLMEP